jgi:hypothetical protein
MRCKCSGNDPLHLRFANSLSFDRSHGRRRSINHLAAIEHRLVVSAVGIKVLGPIDPGGCCPRRQCRNRRFAWRRSRSGVNRTVIGCSVTGVVALCPRSASGVSAGKAIAAELISPAITTTVAVDSSTAVACRCTVPSRSAVSCGRAVSSGTAVCRSTVCRRSAVPNSGTVAAVSWATNTAESASSETEAVRGAPE